MHEKYTMKITLTLQYYYELKLFPDSDPLFEFEITKQSRAFN